MSCHSISSRHPMLLNRSEKLRHHGFSEGEEVVLAYAALRACNVANLSLNIIRVCEAVAGVPAAGFVSGAPSELPAPPRRTCICCRPCRRSSCIGCIHLGLGGGGGALECTGQSRVIQVLADNVERISIPHPQSTLPLLPPTPPTPTPHPRTPHPTRHSHTHTLPCHIFPNHLSPKPPSPPLPDGLIPPSHDHHLTEETHPPPHL